jgi:hypothetical protein
LGFDNHRGDHLAIGVFTVRFLCVSILYLAHFFLFQTTTLITLTNIIRTTIIHTFAQSTTTTTMVLKHQNSIITTTNNNNNKGIFAYTVIMLESFHRYRIV